MPISLYSHLPMCASALSPPFPFDTFSRRDPVSRTTTNAFEAIASKKSA